jgi:hypothetical protein
MVQSSTDCYRDGWLMVRTKSTDLAILTLHYGMDRLTLEFGFRWRLLTFLFRLRYLCTKRNETKSVNIPALLKLM